MRYLFNEDNMIGIVRRTKAGFIPVVNKKSLGFFSDEELRKLLVKNEWYILEIVEKA